MFHFSCVKFNRIIFLIEHLVMTCLGVEERRPAGVSTWPPVLKYNRCGVSETIRNIRSALYRPRLLSTSTNLNLSRLIMLSSPDTSQLQLCLKHSKFQNTKSPCLRNSTDTCLQNRVNMNT